jgi:DNA replication protein DnaC
MEDISKTVLEVGQRVRQATLDRRAELPDCHRHPEYKAVDCPACAEDERRQLAELREQHRTEAVAAAEQEHAKFPPRFRDAVADHPKVLEWVTQFADPSAIPTSLLLLGPTGVGKTWQAYGALRAASLHPALTRTSYRCRFWTAAPFADLMAMLRPRPKVDSEEVMKDLREVDLLLVDDLAAAKGSEWVEEQTYRLINGRYEAMLPTIFTTNLALNELRDAIGDRIASRLAETCTRVVLAGSDRRRTQKAGST